MAYPERWPIPVLDPPEVFYFGPELDRETARALRVKRFFTGEPCIKGHIAERFTSNGGCCECVRQRQALAEFRESYREYSQEWRDGQPGYAEKMREANRAYYRAKRHAG